MKNCVYEKRIITLKEYEKEKGRLENREAVQIAKMICRTLEELHRKKRVYRELCPENIVLVYEEKETSDCLTEVRLEENAAQRQYRDGATEDTVFMGITRYAAPEQYGFAQSVPATDIFAIGVILNEMLTGKTPEEEKTADKGCRYIIEKCCELDWKKRYQNIQNLRKDLDDYLMYGGKNALFPHSRKYRKLAGKGILLGAVCLFLLIFIGRFLQKNDGTDSNPEFSVEKQEDMKQKEEALLEEYQKYTLEDMGVEIYYPRGFHYLKQQENENGILVFLVKILGMTVSLVSWWQIMRWDIRWNILRNRWQHFSVMHIMEQKYFMKKTEKWLLTIIRWIWMGRMVLWVYIARWLRRIKLRL